MSSNWADVVLKNFSDAASSYEKEADLQRQFAWELAKQCAKQSIPRGLWIDLGTGTGLLAEALEHHNPNQRVIRVDGSKKMLAQHQTGKHTQLWDLNQGLPAWHKSPALLASNFALHWLDQPTKRLEEWFTALKQGGWIAITSPVNGSFTEWEQAANAAGVPSTALSFPSQDALIRAFAPEKIKFKKLYRFTQKSSSAIALLKPILRTGAQASPKASNSIGSLRRLLEAWPRSKGCDEVKLTWLIQLLLVQK